MQRITGPTAYDDINGAGKRGFRDGDKANGVIATIVNALFLNGLQEELCGFIESRGITLNQNDNTLLQQAIADVVAEIQGATGTVTTTTMNAAIAAAIANTKSKYDFKQATGVMNAGTQQVLSFSITPNFTGVLDITSVINPAGEATLPGYTHQLTVSANGGAEVVLADDQTLISQVLKRPYLVSAGTNYVVRQRFTNSSTLNTSIARYLTHVLNPI